MEALAECLLLAAGCHLSKRHPSCRCVAAPWPALKPRGAQRRNAPGVAPAWHGVLRLGWGNRAQLLLQGAALSGESSAGKCFVAQPRPPVSY